MMPWFRITPQLTPVLVLGGALMLPLSAPLQAESGPSQNNEGGSLMQRGAELFWEGLREEIAPALDDLQSLADEFGPSFRGFMSEMGPALADIADKVEDWSVYERPEILPNGDIIIRRKPEVAPEASPEDTPAPDLPEGPTDI
ncbi:hypothetical protein [Phaeobacter sp. C3_T13_0]|uniref:hypothetical protein n=1 Tax=Phaeobacter cretensis TaxID=3342641 RepID=UPI0039BD8810